MSIPGSYRDQKACRNCKHYRDIECHGHFCEADKSEFPIMPADKEMTWEERDQWHEDAWNWRHKHSVEPSGICDLHEEKK